MTTREEAIDALVAQLGKIKQGDYIATPYYVDGFAVYDYVLGDRQYALTINKIQRNDRMQLFYESAYPAIAVLDKGDSSIQLKGGGLADIYTEIDLKCYVRSRGSMSEAMNAVDLAVKQSIIANLTLGGVIAHATIKPDAGKDLSGDDDVASFVRRITLFYEGTYTGGM